MELITLIIISFGLAADAFAVSIVKGITTKTDRWKKAILIASSFGAFQIFMPIVGWCSFLQITHFIHTFAPWLGFFILIFLGSKMIYDSIKSDVNLNESFGIYSLLGLSIATSIDALMIGISFAFLQHSIKLLLPVVGVLTFFLSFLGFIFGNKIGQLWGNKTKTVGGIILLGLAFAMFFEFLI